MFFKKARESFLSLLPFPNRTGRAQAKIRLWPHSEVTNMGYHDTFLRYSEKHYRYDNNKVYYRHDGINAHYNTAENIRILLMRNVYASERLADPKTGLKEVSERWSDFRHIVEEAGSIVPELRFQLRSIDYYDRFDELSPWAVAAIKALLEMDRAYFRRKLAEGKAFLGEVNGMRQQRLWPDEFERLKKASYDVVEWDLLMRGYVMHLIVEDINKNQPTPLTKEETKIKVLESLCFNDETTVRAHITDFQSDFENIKKYDDLFDVKKIGEKMDVLLSKAEEVIPQIMASEDEKEANAMFDGLYKEFIETLRPCFLELIRLDEDSRFVHFEMLKYFHIRYVSEYEDISKDDPYGIYRYFFMPKRNLFPMTKITLATLGVAVLFLKTMLEIRTRAFEKEHGVLVGNRSSYAFSREEQFKGEEGH